MQTNDIYSALTKITAWQQTKGLLRRGVAVEYSQMGRLISKVEDLDCDISLRAYESAKNELAELLMECNGLANILGTNIEELLNMAYDKIKDRKGQTIDGKFVKD